MTSSAIMTRGGRSQVSRDDILQALRDYAELFGPDFTTAAFNPSVAKWRDRPEDRERYLAGNPKTGEPWPSLNTIKAAFDGSFNAAREAAGLAPNKPGPGKGKRAAHTVEPIRGVDDRLRVRVVEKSDAETLAKLARVTRERDRAREKVARLETKLKERPKATAKVETKTKTVTKVVKERVRVQDERALERARTKARDAEAKLAAAERAAKGDIAEAEKRVSEARRMATSLAARLERAEATVSELRDERRTLKARADRAEDRATAAERERDALAARKPTVIHEEAPEAEALRAAEQAAHDAELRASRAEREYMKLAAAVKGEARKLTKDEVDELRVKSGFAGPAIVTEAIKGYVVATKTGTKVELSVALSKLASAAISYRDRL